MRYRLWFGSMALVAACGTTPAAPVVGTSTGVDGQSGADGAIGDSTASGDAAGGDAPVLADGTATDADAEDALTPGNDVPPIDVPAAKYTTCSMLLTCSQFACAPDVAAGCETVCTNAATPAATAQFQPVIDCIDQFCRKGICAGGGTANCMSDCAQKKCAHKTLACSADGQSGAATCDTAFPCFAKCADNFACTTACYAALSPAAQTDFAALMTCAAAAGGEDPFKSCPMQALKCTTAAKTGSASCFQTLACTGKCSKGDDACGAKCYADASATAQAQFVAAITCLQAQPGQCAAAMVACIEPNGTKNCVELIVCSDQCKKSGGGDSCTFACVKQGDKAEVAKLLAFVTCSDTQCKPKCAGDPLCTQTCEKSTCNLQQQACLGG